jgi:hypothetical protein
MSVRTLSLLRVSSVLAAAVGLAGCGPSAEIDRLGNAGPLSGPFYVSEHFSPSGHMGDGELPGFITAYIGDDALSWRRSTCETFVAAGAIAPEACVERPPNAGGDPYAFYYEPGKLLWAGVYWVFPANNWGTRPGRDLDPNYRHSRVRFWAATDQPDVTVTFQAGGIIPTDPGIPFRDPFGPITEIATLTYDYKQYVIDLPAGANLSSVIGAFCWATTYPKDGDHTPRTIFIDDVVWE